MEAVPETDIENCWQTRPCGHHLLGGLNEKFRGNGAPFFDAYDADRHRLERHIPRCLDDLDVRGERAREIGSGSGRNRSK